MRKHWRQRVCASLGLSNRVAIARFCAPVDGKTLVGPDHRMRQHDVAGYAVRLPVIKIIRIRSCRISRNQLPAQLAAKQGDAAGRKEKALFCLP